MDVPPHPSYLANGASRYSRPEYGGYEAPTQTWPSTSPQRALRRPPQDALLQATRSKPLHSAGNSSGAYANAQPLAPSEPSYSSYVSPAAVGTVPRWAPQWDDDSSPPAPTGVRHHPQPVSIAGEASPLASPREHRTPSPQREGPPEEENWYDHGSPVRNSPVGTVHYSQAHHPPAHPPAQPQAAKPVLDTPTRAHGTYMPRYTDAPSTPTPAPATHLSSTALHSVPLANSNRTPDPILAQLDRARRAADGAILSYTTRSPPPPRRVSGSGATGFVSTRRADKFDVRESFIPPIDDRSSPPRPGWTTGRNDPPLREWTSPSTPTRSSRRKTSTSLELSPGVKAVLRR
eukprot:TRINITY_DN20811_c0_g1_i1.p1 TRINITY_DN20811_c0_g1~~TRINITY_DN20811_c0_g1_i1.p1  ORF type:complete len:347 (-),score=14.15 TRINITY_DN20811_c0_g1_i1:25-1065(-)